MITNFLLDNSAMVPVVLLLVAVVCVGVGDVVVRRQAVRMSWALVTVAVLPIVALTLVPTSARVDEVVCVVQFHAPTLGRVELLANVALFVPPVYFATLATRRPPLILLAGAATSAVIEAIQAVAPAIGRACDTNDWAMNTGGVLLGVLLATATTALTNRRGARPCPSPPGKNPARENKMAERGRPATSKRDGPQ
ncbi:MAG: VanZ family protein [Actinophytocola sp.]|uniref:VanZ family protein n=1 Tax=Actinophytocola sp. TaxID=1872138 RepID=UPI003D6AD287